MHRHRGRQTEQYLTVDYSLCQRYSQFSVSQLYRERKEKRAKSVGTNKKKKKKKAELEEQTFVEEGRIRKDKLGNE